MVDTASIIGKKVGSYTIGKRIASGGMGEIYLVQQDDPEQEHHEPLVMKVIHPGYKANGDFRKRFLREIRLMASLQHENIVPIYDWGYKNKILYFTMKHIQGPSLAELLETENFTPVSAAEILQPLADALDYVHSQGVMHRDVKPGNILLESEDSGWHVYLSDFGLGKNPERDKLLPMVSRSMGTIEYMSPEASEKEEVDYRTDVFSLTAIAYEMLLGIKPIKRNTKNGKRADEYMLPLPSLLNKEFPYPLEAVLIQGMEADKSKRFQSAREFTNAYHHALLQLTEEQRDTKYHLLINMPGVLMRSGELPN